MKVTSRRVRCMERGYSPIKTNLFTKGTGQTEKKTVKEPLFGQQRINTLANGVKVFSRAREPSLGQMANNSMATGNRARCKAKVNSNGLIILHMKVTIMAASKRVRENSHIQTK